MTCSSKRIPKLPKLSLDNLDPIEKDAYLSTYKLKSISKISTGFPDNSTARVADDLIFGDSDEENSPKNNKYGSTQRPLLPSSTNLDIQNSKTKHMPPLPTYRVKEIDASVDPNDFFENFDDHVKVHYIPDGRQSRMGNRISSRVSKDLSCELACEQERGAKNLSSGRRQRNSSEERINLSKNLIWYLKQSNEKLQPLVNLDSGYSFEEDLKENGVRKSREMNPLPSGICEQRDGVKNHLKERTNENDCSYRGYAKEKEDALNQKYFMQENRQKQKGQSVVMTNQSFENDYEQENDEDALGKRQAGKKENKGNSRQVLRDITNYRQKDYKKPVKFLFDKENEQEKGLNSSELYKKIKESQESSGLESNKSQAMSILESLKKKTEKITGEMGRIQDTVLKDTTAFPGAPRHAESSNKKVGFFRERSDLQAQPSKPMSISKPKASPQERGERKSSKPKRVINQSIIVEDDVYESIKDWAKPKKRTSSISRL